MGVMPAARHLPNAEIAAILTRLRDRPGQSRPFADSEQVAEVRTRTDQRR
jgi:hypothetical protein